MRVQVNFKRRRDAAKRRSLWFAPGLASLFLALVAPAASRAQGPDQAFGPLPGGTYVLDAANSKLSARLRFLGVAPYTLRFPHLEGEMAYSPADLAGSRVDIRVDPRAIAESGYGARQLNGLLEPDRYPVISFASRGLLPTKGRRSLAGDLTLHGVTRPIVLNFTFKGLPPGAGGRANFEGSGGLRRSDFGITAMRGLVGDQVELLFDVQFVAR